MLAFFYFFFTCCLHSKQSLTFTEIFYIPYSFFPGGSDGKASAYNAGDPGLIPGVKISCRQWHPTPVLLPGKSHGRRSLVGYSPWGRKESDMTEWLHIFSFYLDSKRLTLGLYFWLHSCKNSLILIWLSLLFITQDPSKLIFLKCKPALKHFSSFSLIESPKSLVLKVKEAFRVKLGKARLYLPWEFKGDRG